MSLVLGKLLFVNYFINKKKSKYFSFSKYLPYKKVIIISFFIQSQSLFTRFLDPVIQVVKKGIFKIMRHKLCTCLPKLLVENIYSLFFLIICLSSSLLTLSFTFMHMCMITLSANIFLNKAQKFLHFFK